MKPRTVLVTGASSGRGRAMALEFAAQGAYVAVTARRLPLLEELAQEIRTRGGHAVPLAFDVQDAAAVAETVVHLLPATGTALKVAATPLAFMAGTLLMAVTTWVVAESQRLTSCSWADVD